MNGGSSWPARANGFPPVLLPLALLLYLNLDQRAYVNQLTGAANLWTLKFFFFFFFAPLFFFFSLPVFFFPSSALSENIYEGSITHG